MGFVFIEANVKKWGLAPMTGSLAPPPPYGSEQGSILLEAGRESAARGYLEAGYRHSRTATPHSPGPVRSPTDISLAQLSHITSHEDIGEGSSRVGTEAGDESRPLLQDGLYIAGPPPEYASPTLSGRNSDEESPDHAPSSDDPPIPTYDAAVGSERTETPPDDQ